MQRKYPYLNDSSFLNTVNRMKVKEQYVKITVLNFLEKPIQEIQGRVTGGNVNLDGNSAIRRTSNISLVTNDFASDLGGVKSLLSINKKIRLEIGYLNTTDRWKEFDIIWFPLGTYVIINPSISHGTGGINISLQLKDKMCLLNGECGGVISASTEFHKYDTVDENGDWITKYPTIYQIIFELVHHFGGEQIGKIIIDVDTRIKRVMKWTGESSLYFYQQINDKGQTSLLLSTQKPKEGDIVTEYVYGQDVGYVYTDFIYPGELIANAGESVCSILDKIKNVLGNYEYFYDLDGNFIFQEKRNYLNKTKATTDLGNLNNEDYLIDMNRDKSVYVFEDSDLNISYSNSPQYGMIKNDFVIWGVRENASGIKIPIRYHLAIDNKPKVGNTYKCFFYKDEDGIIKPKCPIIYNSISDFPVVGAVDVYYAAGDKIYKWDTKKKEYVLIEAEMVDITATDWRTELYMSGLVATPYATDSNYYYTELNNEWPKLYDIQAQDFSSEARANPSDIDYYLDFIDSTASISELSISNIGRRSKVINDDSINCIFEPEIPDYVIIEAGQPDTESLREECEYKGQAYVQVDTGIFKLLATGGSFNSAYNLVREMLYQYTSYNESISLNTLPIYYLEPNSRITVRDAYSGISGDYIINTISLPLAISGTMNLSCVRALERI